jgi:hypothetical protein
LMSYIVGELEPRPLHNRVPMRPDDFFPVVRTKC